MADQLQILDSYIQMREGNNLREKADLALIKQLREDYEAEQKRIVAKIEELLRLLMNVKVSVE